MQNLNNLFRNTIPRNRSEGKGNEARKKGEPVQRSVIQLAPAMTDWWLDPVGPSKKLYEMCLRTIHPGVKWEASVHQLPFPWFIGCSTGG